MNFNLTYKKLQKLGATSIIALAGLSSIASTAEVAQSVRISPSAANTYFGSSTTSTDGLSGKRSETTPYALVSLARSLGSDRTADITDIEYRTRVFEYVRDNVKTLPYYGVKKGALGAYYDNEGTSFDQTLLMVELIEQRGVMTADIKIGTAVLNAIQWGNMFNVTDAKAACQMLADGGIPATVNSSSACSSLSGTVTSVTMGYAWVYSGATTYDPSYKVHTMEAGIDIDDAMVAGAPIYSESTFWTDASTDITTGTVNKIDGSNITNIENDLVSYSGALVTEFKNNRVYESLDQIIGGRYLDPENQTSLSYGTLTTQRTITGDIPNQYRTSLNVDYGTINKTLYADELYGLRLWMDGLDLMVGNAVVATSSSSDTAMTLTVNHPYAANSGTYGDHSVTITASDLSSATIIFATGTGNHQAARHMVNDDYQNSIVNDTTPPSTQTMAKLSLGANWAVQYGQLLNLDAALGDSTYQHHDTIGVIVSDGSDNITPHLYSSISVNADTGIDADRAASIQTVNTMSGVLLSALIDQARNTGTDDIRSVTSMFAEAIADGDKDILEFTQSNRTNIDTLASHYNSSLRTALIGELAANADLVVLMVDSFTGLDGTVNAEPYVKYDTTANGVFDQLVGDTASSYGTATEIGTAGDLLGGNAGDIIRDNAPQSVSGEYGDSATDIVTGAGGFPMSLPYTRSFQISRIDAPDKGWMHNYDISAHVASNSLMALSHKIAAAQSIASLHVLREMYAARTGNTAQAVVTGALVANWMRNELVDNTFTIRTAGGSDFYYKLADGSFEALSGSLADLTVTGTGSSTVYTVTALSDSDMDFEFVSAGNYRIKQMTWPSGLDVDFTYTSTTLTVANNVSRSLVITDTGANGTIDFVQDNEGRRITYLWDGTTGFLKDVKIDANTTASITKYGSADYAIADFDLVANATTKGWDVKVYDPVDVTTPTITHTLNRLGQIEKSVDRQSNDSTFYPSQRRGETVNVAGGVSTSYTNHQGLSYKTVNALGDVATSTFYGSGLLKRATAPKGNAVEYIYNKYGLKTSVKVYPNNGTGGTDTTQNLETTYIYNTLANKLTLTSITTPDSKVTSFLYDTDGFITKQTLPTVSVYNVSTSSSSNQTPVTDYVYTTLTASGGGTLKLLSTVTAADGTVTKNDYYNTGLPLTTTQDYDAAATLLNVASSYSYDTIGNRHKFTDNRSNEKNTVYNIRRQVQSSNLYGYQVEVPTIFWNDGTITYTTENCTYGDVETTFDAGGRSTKVRRYYTNVLYQDAHVEYDNLGRVSKQKDHVLDTITYNYTEVLGTAITVTAPSGFSSQTAVSMAEVVDPVGRKVRAYTDLLGRTVRTITGYGSTTAVTEDRGYDDAGQLGWVRDGNGNVTKYTYDVYGRADKTTYPDTTYTQASGYDVMSRPATLRKRDGSTFTLSYDAHGRINQRVVKDNTATLERTYVFKFDIMGRSNYAAVTKSAVTTTITMTYDALGRKVIETGAHGYGSTYAYDDATGEVEITYNDPGSDTYKITRLLDQQGLVTSVKETRNSANRDLAYFTYDEMGRMTKHSTGADRDMIYTYETDGDLDKVVNELSSTLSTVDYDYSYNAAGQISSKSISTALYQWSPVANDTINSVANSMNQITTYDGGAVTYDNNGNLKTKGNRTLTWSVENYLEKVVESSVTLGEYKYDALGRRIEKTANSTTTKYIMDGGNVIAEYSGSTLLRRYVYGPGIDRPIAVITPSGSNITREYYHFDGQGSVIATVDDNDVVTASYAYDPYGKVDDLTGNVYRYTGRRIDAETGYYYYRARYYDPDMGRFLSSDPIGYGAGLNMYSYTHNDPVNFTDPSGTDEGCPGCGSVIGPLGASGYFNAPTNANSDSNKTSNELKGLSPSGVLWALAGKPGCGDDPNGCGGSGGQGPGDFSGSSGNAGLNSGNSAAPLPYVEWYEIDINGNRLENGKVGSSGVRDNKNLSTPTFGQCIAGCSMDQFGLTTLTGMTAVALGSGAVKKRFVTKGSSPKTSIASKFLSKKFPQKLPFKVWAPTLRKPLAASNLVGRVGGRFVPVVGWLLLGYDAIGIGICVSSCLDQQLDEEQD